MSLEKLGVEDTPGRTSIMKIFHKFTKPIDITTILSELKRMKTWINRATVFRIINFFTEQGLLKKLEFKEGKFRYELASLPHHHHIVCVKCGIIKDIENCKLNILEKKAEQMHAFAIHSHRLEFFGLCARCQQ